MARLPILKLTFWTVTSSDMKLSCCSLCSVLTSLISQIACVFSQLCVCVMSVK